MTEPVSRRGFLGTAIGTLVVSGAKFTAEPICGKSIGRKPTDENHLDFDISPAERRVRLTRAMGLPDELLNRFRLAVLLDEYDDGKAVGHPEAIVGPPLERYVRSAGRLSFRFEALRLDRLMEVLRFGVLDDEGHIVLNGVDDDGVVPGWTGCDGTYHHSYGVIYPLSSWVLTMEGRLR